jgi:hypothetical protein
MKCLTRTKQTEIRELADMAAAEIRPLTNLEIDSVEGGVRVPPPPGPCFPRRPDKELVLL